MMTTNEIIEMAKRVVGNYEHASYWPFFTEELQHFAKLVEERTAAKEREACALICDSHADDPVYCGAAIRARGDA